MIKLSAISVSSPRLRAWAGIAWVLTLVLATWACGGKSNGVPAPPAIQTQPQARTVTAGQAATFTVSALNATSYQWYEGSAAIQGATGTSYTTPPTNPAMNGHAFKVVATGSGGSVTSDAVSLTVQYYSITTHPQDVTVGDGGPATFTAAGTGNPAEATHQWQRSEPGSDIFVDIAGQTEAGLTLATVPFASDGAKFRRKDVHVTGTYLTNAARLTVLAAPPAILTEPVDRTVQAGQDTTFSFTYGGTVGTVQWFRKPAGGTASAVAGATGTTLACRPLDERESGDEYFATVGNPSGTASTRHAVLTVTPAPTAPHFIVQPQDQTGHIGQTVTFTATASGVPAPTYAWHRNDVAISGETTSSLSVRVDSLAQDNDRFVCVANNGVGGDVASGAAVLHALPALVAPWFTASAGDLTLTVGGTATFTWAAGGNPEPTGVIQEHVGSTWTAIGTGFTLTLDPVGTSDSGRRFRCVASNSEGTVASAQATLTVNPQTFSLSVTLGAGTAGTPAASGAYAQGTVVDYAYSAAPGFNNLVVTVDGAVSPASGSVTMNAAHTIAVSASPVFFSLVYTAGANGTLSGTPSQTVAYGGSGSPVSAVPNPGCQFVNWSDGSTANPRTDTNVLGNIAVTANFIQLVVVPAEPGVTMIPASDTGQYDNDRVTAADPAYALALDASTTRVEMNVDGTGWVNLGLVTSQSVPGLADGTHSIRFRALAGTTPSPEGTEVFVTIMKTSPGRVSENLPDAGFAGASGSGTVLFTQRLPAGYGLLEAMIVDVNTGAPVGGSVTATANGTTTLAVTYTMPAAPGASVRFRFTVRNLAGAQSTVLSSAYVLY